MSTYEKNTIAEMRQLAPTKDDLVYCTELQNYFQLKIPSSLAVDDIEVVASEQFPTGQYIRVSDNSTGGGSSEVEYFIYRPGGVASGNVYIDFLLMGAAIDLSISINIIILVDIPGFQVIDTVTGNKAFDNWSNVTMLIQDGSTRLPSLEFDGEITFSAFPLKIDGVSLSFRNTVSNVVTINGLNQTEIFNSVISNKIINATTPTKSVFNVVSGGMLMILKNTLIDIGDFEVFDGSGGNYVFSLFDNSVVNVDSIRGNWIGSLIVDLSSLFDKTQTNWSGSVTLDGRIAIKEGDLGDNDTLVTNSSGKLIARKNTVSGSAPTVNDDNTQGYVIQSDWLDQTGGVFYKCSDVSTGAAVWKALN